MGRGARAGAAPAGTRARAWRALLWTGAGAPPIGRQLAAGAVVWLAYALAWLALEGPVLDESAAAAPIVAGDAGYPDGHAAAVFYRTAFHLLYQLAALQWAVQPDVWAVSAPRNVVFLFLSAFAPFAAVVGCTGRPWLGHVAAALVLSETVCSAVGTYLMWVFPGVYSSGHYGIHFAVLAAVLLGAGVDRLGGFLVGVMPVLHAAMAVVVWPAAAVVLGLRWLRGEAVGRVVAGGLAGVAVAAGVVVAVVVRTADDRAAAPYEVGSPRPDVVRTFMRTTDPHRQPLPARSPIGLVGPAAFVGFAALALRGRRAGRPRRGREAVVVLGALAWAYALGATLLHHLFGELPLAVLVVMPSRFANLGMLLVVPLAVVALVSHATPRAAAGLAAALLAVEAALLVTAPRLAFVQFLYAILGAVAGAVLASPAARVPRRVAVGVAVALLLATAVVRAADGSRVHVAFLAGLVPGLAASALAGAARRVPRPLAAAVAAACVGVAALAVRGPHLANAWDLGSERVSAEEAAIAAWLRAHATPDAMLLVAPFPPTWLGPKTGHPILFDTMSLLAMTYVPAQAAPVARFVRDVFAIDYTDPGAVEALTGPDGMLRPSSPVWLWAWPGRTCEEWRTLGTRYGFALVLAPRGTRLRLESPWAGPTWTLYQIPPRCPDGTPP